MCVWYSPAASSPIREPGPESSQTEDDGQKGETPLEMTQIVENWARIVGRVEGWDPPAEPDAPGTLIVRVEQVSDIPRENGAAYNNLLKGNEGQSLRILIPAAVAARLKPRPDERVKFDVRRGRSSDHVFARPEPLSEEK